MVRDNFVDDIVNALLWRRGTWKYFRDGGWDSHFGFKSCHGQRLFWLDVEWFRPIPAAKCRDSV